LQKKIEAIQSRIDREFIVKNRNGGEVNLGNFNHVLNNILKEISGQQHPTFLSINREKREQNQLVRDEISKK
jgi:hypothetical protein